MGCLSYFGLVIGFALAGFGFFVTCVTPQGNLAGAAESAALTSFVGTAFVCFGSYVANVAPDDGQTGMVTFPCWYLGAVILLFALMVSIWDRNAIVLAF